MIGWLDVHAGTAAWLALLSLAAALGVAFVRARRLRRRREMIALCAALYPIRALGEGVRVLRESLEQGDGAGRLVEVDLLVDGTLAQRLRDVRGLVVHRLPTPRAIEAAYEAREAAARLMMWLERHSLEPIERRHSVQRIWKTLHDAAGNLERDLARLESAVGGESRRF